LVRTVTESKGVVGELLDLIRRAVQRNAMRAWEEGADFLGLLKSDSEVSARLTPAALEACFDLSYHMKQVDQIFGRVFGAA